MNKNYYVIFLIKFCFYKHFVVHYGRRKLEAYSGFCRQAEFPKRKCTPSVPSKNYCYVNTLTIHIVIQNFVFSILDFKSAGIGMIV